MEEGKEAVSGGRKDVAKKVQGKGGLKEVTATIYSRITPKKRTHERPQ